MGRSMQCPQCGANLSEGAPAGLCPACLLKPPVPDESKLDTVPDTSQINEAGDVGPDQTNPAPPLNGAKMVEKKQRFVAPTLEKIADAFPQLEVQELIGMGGMGAVYKARQKTLGRKVALKVLPTELAKDAHFADRFLREAQALAKLNHPNIVSVYDFGHAGDYYFILMEYVDGANLRQVQQAGRLSPAQALAIVPLLCDALQYAHDEGVIHRDIKPANILLDNRGRVKIADFGIAKLRVPEPDDLLLTGTNQVVGTWQYMAPEQFEKSKDVDHRADIYSLGVVFYEMLTGELPLGRFEPPSKKSVQIDLRMDEVVLKTLEKDPQRRYQQACQIKSDVDDIYDQCRANTKNSAGIGMPAPLPKSPNAPTRTFNESSAANCSAIPAGGGRKLGAPAWAAIGCLAMCALPVVSFVALNISMFLLTPFALLFGLPLVGEAGLDGQPTPPSPLVHREIANDGTNVNTKIDPMKNPVKE